MINVAPGERFRFSATVTAWDDDYSKHTEDLTAVCIGGAALLQDADGYYAEETGESTYLLLYEGDFYAILSHTVTVRVQERGGCAGSAGIGGALFSLPLLAAAGIALLKKRKKVG